MLHKILIIANGVGFYAIMAITIKWWNEWKRTDYGSQNDGQDNV
jgi:hypothetical protein